MIMGSMRVSDSFGLQVASHGAELSIHAVVPAGGGTQNVALRAPGMDAVNMDTGSVLREAVSRVQKVDYPFVDFNVAATSRVLLFTVCASNSLTEQSDQPAVEGLCDTWWANHGNKWAKQNQLAVAMITDSANDGRAIHWAKVYYSYAFLVAGTGAQFAAFDYIVFADSDSVVRLGTWDVRRFFGEHLPNGTDCLLPSDDWDFISSGEMFIKNTLKSEQLFKHWYSAAPSYFGSISTGDELQHASFMPTVHHTTRANLRGWHEQNESRSFVQGGIIPEYHPNGHGHVTVDRCSDKHTTHEQGCFKHIFDSHPSLSSVSIVDATDVHALRWEWAKKSRHWIFLHVCCTSYAERKQLLSRCIEPLNSGRNCTPNDATEIVAHSYPRRYPIVWVHLGDFSKGAHVQWSVKQAWLWNPDAKLILLTNSPAIVEDQLRATIAQTGLHIVDVTQYDSNAMLQDFKANFFVKGDLGGGNNDKDFNLLTSTRLFYLAAWMADTAAEHVLHLESDNMLYFNFQDFVSQISTCNLRVGVQCRSMRPDSRYMVLGLVYVRDPLSLSTILQSIVGLLKLGQAATEVAVAMDTIVDMSLFAWFYYSKMNAGSPPPITGPRMQPYTPTDLLTILPEGMASGNGLDDPKAHVDLIRKCVWDESQLMFDNAALGIWHFGSFHYPFAQTVADSWGAYQRIPAPDRGDLVWVSDPKSGLTAPTWEGARLGSIHMHNKQLMSIVSRKRKSASQPQVLRIVKGQQMWRDVAPDGQSSARGRVQLGVVLVCRCVIVAMMFVGL